MSADTPPRPVSFRRRTALAVLALVVALFAVGLVSSWRGDATRLDLLVAELDERDPNWRLEDLDAGRAEVPEDQNSAPRVVAIAGRVPGNWPDYPAITPPEGTPANERLDDGRLERLRREMAAVETLRAEARALIGFPRGRHLLEINHRMPMATRVENQQRVRRVSSLLYFDAVELAHRGEVSAALRSAHAGVNNARSLGDEPLMISQLIRAACLFQSADAVERSLALGGADEKTLAGLQAILAEDEKHNGLLCAWRGERAALHATMSGMSQGRVGLRDIDFGGLPAGLRFRMRFLPWTQRRLAADEHAVLLRMADRAVQIARLPPHEQAAAEGALDADLRKANTSLGQVLVPPLGRVSTACRRNLALTRCLIALLAAERFRLKQDRWPADLNELKPALLAEVPLDPVDGKPLRYRKLADGVVVYSVGFDGTDDGGKLSRARPTTPGTDLGYRLWDAGWRNRPATGK